MRAPPKTTMILARLALERRDRFLERRSRRGGRCSRSPRSRLCEKTTFGSPFISTAIGLSDPDQPLRKLHVAAAAHHDRPDLAQQLEVARWRRAPWSGPPWGESQSMTPSVRATKPSSDIDMCEDQPALGVAAHAFTRKRRWVTPGPRPRGSARARCARGGAPNSGRPSPRRTGIRWISSSSSTPASRHDRASVGAVDHHVRVARRLLGLAHRALDPVGHVVHATLTPARAALRGWARRSGRRGGRRSSGPRGRTCGGRRRTAPVAITSAKTSPLGPAAGSAAGSSPRRQASSCSRSPPRPRPWPASSSGPVMNPSSDIDM